MNVLSLAPVKVLTIAALAAVAALGFNAVPSSAAEPQAKVNKYVGAQKCKNCHSSAEAGDQYGVWQKMDHAKAFEVLGSEEAKKIASEKGIADPQKDEQCVKCHVTAFGVPAEQIAKGFDPKLGVQCETCHGPGEQHMKARLAAAAAEPEGAPKTYVKIPDGELVASPPVQKCLECHNSGSPTFKAFCYPAAVHKTRHANPLKPRTDEEKKALEFKGCGDGCKCTDGCPQRTCGECPEDR
jgi:hypothetical protein